MQDNELTLNELKPTYLNNANLQKQTTVIILKKHVQTWEINQ